MKEENVVHSESTDGVVSVPAGMAMASVDVPRVVLTLPMPWTIRGYVQAVRRFEAAASESPEAARDVYIALFEACHWIDSLAERTELSSDAKVRAFQFVRNRSHHVFATAVSFDQASNEWMWGSVANMPLPDNPRHRQEGLEQLYEHVLAGKPVRDVLRHIEKLVVALDPTEDFR